MYEASDLNDAAKWFKANKSLNVLHDQINAFVKHLDESQNYRSSDNLRHARLYGNYEALGLDAYSYTRVDKVSGVTHRVTMNIVQNMIDTVVSKITKNKPRPMFLTDEGNWELQQKAKKLTKFVDGIFNSCKFYSKAAAAFLDACIFGTGAIKIFKSYGEIKCERVFIEELKIDDVESFYSEPRQMHQVKHIHKDVLIEMFPDKEMLISQIMDDQKSSSYDTKSRDMIKVTESWHIKSGPKAKDGRHAIVANGVTLLDEDYDKKYFPFIFFRWGIKPVGFFGQGLAEQLKGIQLEINKILRTIQLSMHLVSIPKIFIEASSKIVSSHLNNKIGGIIKYAGTKPDAQTLGQIPSDLFNHLDRLYNRAYEIAGISQLAAQSQKPVGVESGKALRTLTDIESERFLEVGRRYEDAFLEAAEMMVDMARDLYKENKEFSVKVKGSKFIETIKWSEVDMEEDKYMMDVFPTSALSHDPAGRMADIQDLIDAGFIGKEEGRKLLNFPDLQGDMNMLNADSDNLEKVIFSMMEKGKYIPPEPYQNLENAIRKTQQAYLMYKVQNAPDSKLDLLRRYMEQAQGLIVKSQSQGAPTQNQMVQNLAAQGASGAAQTVADQANIGAEPVNPLVEGAIPLSPEAMTEEDVNLIPEEELIAL